MTRGIVAAGLLLIFVGSAGALAAEKKTGISKGETPGFVETLPPPVELGVTEGATGEPGSEPKVDPGVVKPSPDKGASSKTDSDIDISEIGRLMDAQNAGGNTETAIPGRGGAEQKNIDFSTYAWRAVASLAFVLLLIVMAVQILRKYGRRSSLLTALAGPGLATVLGKVHLGRGASLHYVETGGRVLIIGVTQTSISLVAEFDAAAFDALRSEPEEALAEAPAATRSIESPLRTASPKPKLNFLQQLLSSTRAIEQPASSEASDDADITQLRGDIERLQKHLQDLSRESRD